MKKHKNFATFGCVMIMALAYASTVTADIVNAGWGYWDTTKWNRGYPGTLASQPPPGIYPPGPEREQISQTTLWIWNDSVASTDPTGAWWVRGPNRTVEVQISQFRQISGYFTEPDLTRMNPKTPENKPTYYFGVVGTYNEDYIQTDAGIQWEPAVQKPTGRTKAGWTLVHRVTVNVRANNTPIGTWHLWQQDPPEKRVRQGDLGTIHMTYYVGVRNEAQISFYGHSGGRHYEAFLYNPTQWLHIESLRRVVGLTQKTDMTQMKDIDPKETNGLPKVKVLPPDKNTKLVTQVCLDNSEIRRLNFYDGKLGTFRQLDAHDPPQQEVWWKGDRKPPARDAHLQPDRNGNIDRLRPPDRCNGDHDGNGPYIIDFVQAPTGARATNNAFRYQTGYRLENVRITLGYTLTKTTHLRSRPRSKRK